MKPDLEAECWAFALAIYARPGVAEACLTLQNEAGLDVMLLLTTTFANPLRDVVGGGNPGARPEPCPGLRQHRQHAHESSFSGRAQLRAQPSFFAP